MLCVENCIHCRALSDSCAPQWGWDSGKDPASILGNMGFASAQHLLPIFAADGGSSTSGFRPPGCSLLLPSPHQREPIHPVLLGDSDTSTFPWEEHVRLKSGGCSATAAIAWQPLPGRPSSALRLREQLHRGQDGPKCPWSVLCPKSPWSL